MFPKKTYIVLLYDWKNIFFRKQKMKQTTINVLKRCQCLFLNIISILYSNNGDFGLHPQIIRIRIVKTKNSALKSDNAHVYFVFQIYFNTVHPCSKIYMYTLVVAGVGFRTLTHHVSLWSWSLVHVLVVRTTLLLNVL